MTSSHKGVEQQYAHAHGHTHTLTNTNANINININMENTRAQYINKSNKDDQEEERSKEAQKEERCAKLNYTVHTHRIVSRSLAKVGCSDHQKLVSIL